MTTPTLEKEKRQKTLNMQWWFHTVLQVTIVLMEWFADVEKLFLEKTFSVKNVVTFKIGDSDGIVLRTTEDFWFRLARSSRFTISPPTPLAGVVP